MRKIVTDINDKLKNILAELEIKKDECCAALNLTKTKIDEKFEEAKSYKLDVDALKEKITILEEEISSLEVDLNDLNERFGKKELNAIIEAGNKEINSKIIAKQKEITKHREKIGELTEKARAIKDLLINLKKDKESKNEKYNNYTMAYEFYNNHLNEIISFSSENPDNLLTEKEETVIVTNYSNEEINSPVFDEIKELDENDNQNDYILNNEEKDYQKIDFSAINNQIDKEYDNIFGHNEEIKIEEEPTNEEGIISTEEIEETPEKTTDVIEEKYNNISLDIDSLIGNPTENDTILESAPAVTKINEPPFSEPSNIISFEPILTPEEPQIEEDHSGFTEFDIFKNSYQPSELIANNNELIELFTNNNIDFNNFTEQEKKLLEDNYNKEMYNKMFDVLKRNNISLDHIYYAANLFYEGTPSEIEHVISKLLLAGQTTTNISYVLSALPLINSYDLSEVIKSYGTSIKDVNITDIIIKTKHLSQMGGNR